MNKNQNAIDILKMFATDAFQRCTSSEFDDAIRTAIEALTEAELYKLALFAVIKNSTVMPAGKKLGKNMHEINKMSVETMYEVLKMCDFEKLREYYKDGEQE